MISECRSLLAQGIEQLGVNVEAEQFEKLLQLLELLHKWNGAYNLTAVRDPQEMVSRHFLDSLSVVFAIKGPRLLDVGSGPGFPGMVLAILRPDIQVTLLDSNGKKVRFQRQSVMELKLDNVICSQVRVESFEGQFEQIISRAFAALGDFISLTKPLLADSGEWLAMKGSLEHEERDTLPSDVIIKQTQKLDVPGLGGAERTLLWLAKKI